MAAIAPMRVIEKFVKSQSRKPYRIMLKEPNERLYLIFWLADDFNGLPALDGGWQIPQTKVFSGSCA